MQFKLKLKTMIGNNTLFEGTFKQVWQHLLDNELDKPLVFINNTFIIEANN